MPEFIRVKNWEHFQHYKDRSAPWLKFYRDMLDTQLWVMESDASKLLAVCIMVLALRNNNKIPRDLEYIKRFSHLEETPDLIPLVKHQFIEFIDENGCFQDASSVLATCTPEKRREEERRGEVMSDNPSDVPDPSPPEKKNGHHYNPMAREVLDFLNNKTGRNYQPVEANLKLIVARLKEGATVQDCKSVVAKKAREWGPDPKMAEYLRPATLFNSTKFAQYAGELVEAE